MSDPIIKAEGKGDEDFGTILETTTEAGIVADVVSEHIKARILKVKDPMGEVAEGDAVPVLILPRSLRAESIKPILDEYRERPERRRGTAKLGDLTSFIAHANRFKELASALFANPDPKAPSLTSVLDYHEAGDAGLPAWGQHRGVYAFPLSDEWTKWMAQNEQLMTQIAFAAWIEEHIVDIADPGLAGDAAKALVDLLGARFAPPATLLETSRGLRLMAAMKMTNAVNLSSGENEFVFTTEHQDHKGGKVQVPSAFLIAIPVFRRGPLYKLAVRLRYRVDPGVVKWSFSVHGADRVFDHAFTEACDTATKETGLPLFIGSPE